MKIILALINFLLLLTIIGIVKCDDFQFKIDRMNQWASHYRKAPVKIKEWETYPKMIEKELEITSSSGIKRERGVFAIDNIQEGTELVNLPWMNVLSLDLVSVEINELYDNIKSLNLTTEDTLVIGLLVYSFCMEDENFGLKSWIQSLPKSYDNALYFEEEDFEYLKGSPGFVHAMIEKDEAKELYARLEKDLFNNSYFKKKCPKANKDTTTFSFEQFRWAVSTISTRKIYTMNPEDDGLTVIVPPFIDFINYNSEPTSSFEMGNHGGSLILTANRRLKKGEEITLNYGSQDCNSDLFIDYGFVDFNENALSCVNILYEELLETISIDDSKKNEKAMILDKFYYDSPQPPRLKLFKDSMTEELLKISKYLSYKSSSLLPYLRSLIDLKLSHYPTSLVADQRFLKSNDYQNLSHRSKLAFQVSYREKLILQEVDQHLESQIHQNSNQDSNTPQQQQQQQQQNKVKDEL